MRSHFTKKRGHSFTGMLSLLLLLTTSFITHKARALQAVVMHNIFYAPGEAGALNPYLETYWQIDPGTVVFDKDAEGKWQARIRTDIIIRNETGIVGEEHYILTTSPVATGAETLTQNIIDLRRFQLPAGKFALEIKFSDEVRNNNTFVHTDSFAIAAPGTQPIISDIQLVDTAIASTEKNIFQRNDRLQIPLCTNFLDDRRKTLNYYAELYHTDLIDKARGPLTCKISVSKKEAGHPVNRLVRTDTVSAALLQITEGKFSVATLSSGNYYLNILLEDNNHEKVASKSLFFQLMNPKPEAIAEGKSEDTATGPATPTYLDLNKTFVGKYTPPQIRAILKMLAPVADPNEKNSINAFLKKPDDTYARYFIYNFWIKRDKLNPEGSWKEYAEKVKQVNKLFGSSMLPGYENDRGIIYLKYGVPTERIITENENGAVPYEVWQYNTLPGATNAVFLFYRPGFVSNDYKLLHSTVNGEVRNRSWRVSLYPGGASADPANSRAEQFLGNR